MENTPANNPISKPNLPPRVPQSPSVSQVDSVPQAPRQMPPPTVSDGKILDQKPASPIPQRPVVLANSEERKPLSTIPPTQKGSDEMTTKKDTQAPKSAAEKGTVKKTEIDFPIPLPKKNIADSIYDANGKILPVAKGAEVSTYLLDEQTAAVARKKMKERAAAFLSSALESDQKTAAAKASLDALKTIFIDYLNKGISMAKLYECFKECAGDVLSSKGFNAEVMKWFEDKNSGLTDAAKQRVITRHKQGKAAKTAPVGSENPVQ